MEKHINKILWVIVLSTIMSVVCVSAFSQINPRFQSVRVDSVRPRASDTIYITDNEGSRGWIRTSGDSLFLGDGIAGEKHISQIGVGLMYVDTIHLSGTQILNDDSIHWIDAIPGAVIVPHRVVVKKSGGYYDQGSHNYIKSHKQDGVTQQDICILYELDDPGWDGSHIIFSTYSTSQSQMPWTQAYEGGENQPIWIQCAHYGTSLTGVETNFEIYLYYTIAYFE